MVSAYLNALKNDKNLSIKDISNLSGIPTSTLLKIFDGSTADPRVSTAYQVVKAMGGSLDEMVGIKPVSQMDTINDETKIWEALQSRVEQNASMIALLKKSRYVSLALNIILGIAIIIISIFWKRIDFSFSSRYNINGFIPFSPVFP